MIKKSMFVVLAMIVGTQTTAQAADKFSLNNPFVRICPELNPGLKAKFAAFRKTFTGKLLFGEAYNPMVRTCPNPQKNMCQEGYNAGYAMLHNLDSAMTNYTQHAHEQLPNKNQLLAATEFVSAGIILVLFGEHVKLGKGAKAIAKTMANDARKRHARF